MRVEGRQSVNIRRTLLLLVSHGVVLAAGFALGLYSLPILIAPPSPSVADIRAQTGPSAYQTRFRRDLEGSDFLHWGEGEVLVGASSVGFVGKLTPGPDYKLYLSPRFVETEADFLQLKSQMLQVGDIRTFQNFLVKLPESVDLERYDTVVVWCEAFNQFITAATYR